MPLNEKPVLSMDTGNWIMCAWSDCERRGVQSNMSVLHDHAKGLGCDHPDAKHPRYIFCTNRHKQFFDHSHIELGKLPAGYRSTIL